MHSGEGQDTHEEIECSGWVYALRGKLPGYQYQLFFPQEDRLYHLPAEIDGGFSIENLKWLLYQLCCSYLFYTNSKESHIRFYTIEQHFLILNMLSGHFEVFNVHFDLFKYSNTSCRYVQTFSK